MQPDRGPLAALWVLLVAIASHVAKATFLLEDGDGLPKKPTPSFLVLVAVATIAAVIRHAVIGEQSVIGAACGFLILIMLLAAYFGEKRFQCLCIYLCVSTGIDVVIVMASGLEVPVSPWIPGIWEMAGLGTGVYRYTRRHTPAQN